ncbi:MAG: response regulator [Comamonadaceae bacterium]|nr:response regulator [Comamonadaceae bacterium]
MEVRFEVQDTGIGIAPEAMSRLFSAFEQADNSMTRKYGGTGLGLRITQRLAELMGGAAGASSTPGLGSVFWFTAKLKKGASDAIDVEAPADLADVDARTLVQQRYSESRMLVVDDDPVNRKLVQRLLKSTDIVVDTAVDWQEALDQTRQHLYRVIFLSLQMPAVEGADAVQQIRQMEGYLQTPVIGMTAEVLADDPLIAGAAAVSDCLTKPVDSNALFELLLRALTELELPQRSAPEA